MCYICIIYIIISACCYGQVHEGWAEADNSKNMASPPGFSRHPVCHGNRCHRLINGECYIINCVCLWLSLAVLNSVCIKKYKYKYIMQIYTYIHIYE